MPPPSPCLDESTFMDLLMGTLAPERAAKLDAHLDECISCRRMVADALRVQDAPGPSSALTSTQVPTVAVSIPSVGRGTPARGEDAPLERGSAVGRYLVLERLGTGGMGVVYSAYDPELDRRIALKLLRVRALGLDAEKARSQLLHEAQAMARVSHPNVVPVYDVGTFGSLVFLAMELVEAQTLRQWLKEAPRPWRQVRDVLVEAGKGLAAAHAAGIVHGDFKPENVLVARDGRVRVTDFGLARTASAPQEARAEGQLLSGGTPAYMAPEQFAHEGHADARSDQFSFCAALYLGLYGERPFAGETYQELSAEVATGRVRPAPKGTTVPPWLRRVVLQGLALRPEERHASLEALLAALQADPTARWRRGAQLGGGLLLLVGAVGVTYALSSRAQRACEGAERELEGIWGSEQKQAMKAAFLGTGKPFAEAAWKGVRRGLDAYTAAWVTTRTAACEATRVRGEQPEDVMAQRMRCLDQRLAEVSALTHLFARADGELVERAARAVERLTPLEGCSDVAALAALGPAPSSPEARQHAQELRHALAEAQALSSAGRYARGAARVEPVAARAKAARERSDAADALLLLAELQDKAGNYRGAEASVLDAVWQAEAGRNDEAAARAWTLAVRIAGERLEQYPDAEHWRQRAEAAIERLGGGETLRARLAFHVGGMRYRQGRFPEAAEQFEAALAPLEKAFGPESLEVADVRIELGAARLAQGLPDEAMALLEQALGAVRGSVGPDHPEVARVLLEEAGVRWQQHKLEEAERLSREALLLLERGLGPEHPQVGNALNVLASAIQYQSRPDEAMPLYERAMRIVEKSEGQDSSFVAVLVSNYANALTLAGRHEEAKARFTQALAAMERKLGPEHPNLVPVLRSMGQTLSRQKRYEEALPYFQRAVRIQTAQEYDVFSMWTGALVDLGRTYFNMYQPKKALEPLEKALAGWERAKTTPGERATIHYLLGKSLWETETDRSRALRLVAVARELGVQGGRAGEAMVRNIDEWVATLPPEARREFAEGLAAPATAAPAPP